METEGVVLSRVVADVGRSLAFYRDGLGMSGASATDGIVHIQLVGMTLFLAEADVFARNTGQNQVVSGPGRSDGVISCAIRTTARVDQLVASARAAGSPDTGTRTIEHSSGRRQYIGSVTDPDGYLWQLVCTLGGTPRIKGAEPPAGHLSR
ncbi:VOC family protein [Specibacter sp. AOP5-B1-6]|uniref:VOC family protein n=1 Tax=Specibacter sp. AOP5-B1-6 TaxID=3457653 RepID=UPI003FB761E1